MKTKILKLNPANIDLAKISEAANIIDTGGFVGFPTETVYGIACRVKSDSLSKLGEIKGRTTDKFYTLHIARSEDVSKYVPTIGLRTRKLIANAWPGPLTIVFELEKQDIEKQKEKLDEEVFQNLYKNNSIGIRCPDNAVATPFLEQIQNPVVAPSANIAGQPPPVNPQQVLAQLNDKIDILLDAGPCKYKVSSTVVKIGKKDIEFLRQGAYSQSDIEALSRINILFVCTGNTCRSPMAEGIFKKYLSEKLQCKVDELEKIGYKVKSAGIMDMSGAPATAEAVAACYSRGVDIGGHRNKVLSVEMIDESDFVFAMEDIHKTRVIALDPSAAHRCLLLAGDKGIPDPIGGRQKRYDDCAQNIEKAVKKRIGELFI